MIEGASHFRRLDPCLPFTPPFTRRLSWNTRPGQNPALRPPDRSGPSRTTGAWARCAASENWRRDTAGRTTVARTCRQCVNAPSKSGRATATGHPRQPGWSAGTVSVVTASRSPVGQDGGAHQVTVSVLVPPLPARWVEGYLQGTIGLVQVYWCPGDVDHRM